jgi:radical SAM superfamily enzyme YgiQ (UPF0313 family)
VAPVDEAVVAAAQRPRVLLITPPFVQLNTPYPATCYLAGWLGARGVPAWQADLSLETALGLFSRGGLTRLFARAREAALSDGDRAIVRALLAREAAYLETIDPVVRLLQGRDPSFAARVCAGGVLPEGPRFAAAQVDLDWAFGALGLADRARYLASLYLDDLADLARAVCPHFGLSRYGEALARSARTLDPLLEELARPPSLIDQLCDEALAPHLERARPDLVALTVPFPGNLLGALRIAKRLRERAPEARIALGGGFVNTELRTLADPRLFDLVDFVTVDDGEAPLAALVDRAVGGSGPLVRTFVRERGEVRLEGAARGADPAQEALPAPSYRGLPLDRYLSVLELANPMHRLWSDGRWLKLTVAHGCYWKRCTFCDVGLDYIARYDPSSARALADRMDALAEETGQGGFHFVDEAAPPLSLIELALELIARGRAYAWWGNIRFEKTFTRDVCRLLVASGCIAVSGGLEVASDRLLALMDKGVTVAQVARVASAFSEAGALVHAYLMYGFPTETASETVDALERVRQLFSAGAIHSAFWHRFTLTRHSPIAAQPARFRIKVLDGPPGPFSDNDLAHRDLDGLDARALDRYGAGLERAVYNYLHGVGLERDVRSWFDGKVPRARVAPDLVARALGEREQADPARPAARLAWIGGAFSVEDRGRARARLRLHCRTGERQLALRTAVARWAGELLDAATPRSGTALPRRDRLGDSFPGGAKALARFLRSRAWRELNEAGLLELP